MSKQTVFGPLNHHRLLALLPLSFLLSIALIFLAPDKSRAQQAVAPQRWFNWTDVQFSRQEYQQRRQHMVRALRESGGGILLVPSRAGRSEGETFRQWNDFLYFTGLELPDSVLAMDSDEGLSTLFTPTHDARFESRTRPNDFPGRPLLADPLLAERSGLKAPRDIRALSGAVIQWLKNKKKLRINAGQRRLPQLKTAFIHSWSAEEGLLYHLQQTYPEAQIENAFVEVAQLRMVKSPAEIAVVRRACRLTAESITEAARCVRAGIDERSLEATLEAAFKRGGSQRLAFSSIIKSGPNSLWPWRILAAHYDRRNRVLQDGELVIFDVGCELDFYASDVGRTFPVSGTFSADQRRILKMQLEVINEVINAAQPGQSFEQLKRLAIAKIPESQRPYMQAGGFFGHHIGLATGDPSLPELPLQPGMIFTVEPWYYNHSKQIAVFIEDVILITEEGAENLTAFLPRTPEALEKLMEGGS